MKNEQPYEIEGNGKLNSLEESMLGQVIEELGTNLKQQRQPPP